MECWASELGGCGGGQSSEHILSACLFDESEMVRVKGLGWCEDDFKIVPLLEGKVLCAAHNNALSPFDEEAKKFKSTLIRYAVDGVPAGAVSTIKLDGMRFSRWLTKTYCNIKAISRMRIAPDAIRYSFVQPLDGELHFSLNAHAGHVIDVNPRHLGYRDYLNDGGSLFYEFVFYGWQWIVTDFEVAPADRLRIVGQSGDKFKGTELLERPKGVEMQIGGHVVSIDISWN